jgi:DNA-binding response OmpR family regulator
MSTTILVVDDEDDILKLLRKILESEGFAVVDARDGEEALKRVREARPSLVVLDLNLPKIDGFEVCSRIKRDPELKAIPVIMLTAAYDKVEHAEKGLSLGADEYVVKPFLREVLLHNINRLLARARAAQAR